MAARHTLAVRAEDPRRDVLERLGWTVAGESWGARLRLDAPGTAERQSAEKRLRGAVDAGEARGYRVGPAGSESAAAIASLDGLNAADYPSTPSTAHTAPTVDEVRHLFSDGVRFYGAWDGDDLVAISGIRRLPDRAETEFTSVRADHRGRGLAYAVKAAGILALAAEGVTVFGTGGAAANAGSLAMNRGLGYVVEEHWYDYEAPGVPVVRFRLAEPSDLERIVHLIADDAVAAARTGQFGDAHWCTILSAAFIGRVVITRSR